MLPEIFIIHLQRSNFTEHSQHYVSFPKELSLKTKMRIANTPATIDSNYRGEIGIIVENIDPPIKDITYEPVLNKDGTIKELNITSILYGESFFIS